MPHFFDPVAESPDSEIPPLASRRIKAITLIRIVSPAKKIVPQPICSPPPEISYRRHLTYSQQFSRPRVYPAHLNGVHCREV